MSSDRSIPTYFKLALHASMMAAHWRRLATKARTKRERAACLRSAELDEQLAQEAWKRFTRRDTAISRVPSGSAGRLMPQVVG